MTLKESELVRKLRHKLLRAGYPPVFVVSNEELEAAEKSIIQHLEDLGEPPILKCGKNGLWFKGVELVLEYKIREENESQVGQKIPGQSER